MRNFWIELDKEVLERKNPERGGVLGRRTSENDQSRREAELDHVSIPRLLSRKRQKRASTLKRNGEGSGGKSLFEQWGRGHYEGKGGGFHFQKQSRSKMGEL